MKILPLFSETRTLVVFLLRKEVLSATSIRYLGPCSGACDNVDIISLSICKNANKTFRSIISQNRFDCLHYLYEWGGFSYHKLNCFDLPFHRTYDSFPRRNKNTANLTLQVESNRFIKMRCSHLNKHFLIYTHMKHSRSWDEEAAHKGEK